MPRELERYGDRLVRVRYLYDAQNGRRLKTGADWQTTARLVLSFDLEADLKAARAVYDAHLALARWMTRARLATSPEVSSPH